MRDKLVILADKLDREGKHELADAIDQLLITAAGRPKAPLKGLGEDVKKDLLKFIHRVKDNAKNSSDSLEELGRRLRYFNAGHFMKELGLEKAVKDLGKVQECADMAMKSMYAMSYGKSPTSSDMEQMADDFNDPGGQDIPSPLDFFSSQEGIPQPSFDERELEMQEEGEGDVLEEDLKSMYDSGGPTEEDRDANEAEWREMSYEDEGDDDLSEEDLGSFWAQEDEE